MRRDLFDIVPLARDTAVEQSSEGMVILDSDRRVRDFNPTAADLVPGLPSGRGEPLDRVLDGAADIFGSDGKATVTLSPAGEELTYLSVQVSEITDGPHHLGWTVTLSDVTDQRKRERHLQLVSRVLRHNMANRIDTIMGHVELLAADADPADRAHLRAIDDSATSIIETSVKLRTIQEIVTAEETGYETDISRSVEVVVEKYADRYPDATVTADCPDGVTARCPPGFRAALDNLVENGIEHDPDPSPTVAVDVTVGESLVHVRVTDDGPGIPESERRILEEGETPLRHSSGVGLWLVSNFVEQAGHELAFETTRSGGSEVRFSLDRTR
jgi:signal transduction histidine kinase